MQSTSASLLERVRLASDGVAWGRFVSLYTPLIFRWGRQCGLQEQDAADLTQEVFTTLFQVLPEFSYDRHKSFRAWLRTMTLNHWRDQAKRIASRPLSGNEAALASLAAPDGVSVLEEAEYREHLLSQALRLLRDDFQPGTWEAFWQHGVLGRPAAEVADELDITLAAVYGAKFRVLNRLRQELQGLLD